MVGQTLPYLSLRVPAFLREPMQSRLPFSFASFTYFAATFLDEKSRGPGVGTPKPRLMRHTGGATSSPQIRTGP